MRAVFYVLLLLIFLMGAFTSKEPADFVVINAKVYLIDDAFSTAESFAVAGGRILSTGTNAEILAKYQPDEVVDGTGKYVYPGFIDGHCHFSGYGENLMQYADLTGTSGPEEIYSILQEHNETYHNEWLLGRGWDQNDWKVKSFPGNEELDVLFSDIPVFLIRIDGHAAWCNTRAMEMAGISAATKVQGGVIELINGKPSGILIDNAMSLVSKILPPVTRNIQKSGLLQAQKNCFAAGITSVTDCGIDYQTIHHIEQLQESNQLKMRVNAMISATDDNLQYFEEFGAIESERLMVHTIKIFVDGALGSRGALLLDDYSDDIGNRGLQVEPQMFYDKICRWAIKNNFIVAAHAIGDRANRLILDTYSSFLKENNDRRWRIEHVQVIHPDDLDKFFKYSVVPSIQATHCTSDMNWVADRLGQQRLTGAYAYHSLLKQNDWLVNGTDFPVEDINPLYTFHASVFRTDHNGHPAGGWNRSEGLTREQAIRSMTLWAAKASFEDKVKGSIEPGKFADFVILDTDLMDALPEEVLNARVISTWINGEKVFESNP